MRIYSHLYSAFSIVQCSNALYRLEDTRVIHLYEKSMHTLCAINEQPLQAAASTILDQILSHTYAHNGVYVALQLFLVILVSDQ